MVKSPVAALARNVKSPVAALARNVNIDLTLPQRHSLS
jgi:hypothetical protein